jgi:predicted secreted protein
MELRVTPGPAEVRLPEAPTTGYVWTLADPPAGVSLTRSDYVPPPGDRVGGQGERVFGLEVTAPGRYELDFHLGRSSSSEAQERRTVTLIAER